MMIRNIKLVCAVLVTAATLTFWSDLALADDSPAPASRVADQLNWRPRLEEALGKWCRALAEGLYQIPGTDLYTLNPTLGTGRNPYRDVAGNQFAAAVAAYWLGRAEPEEEVAVPLRGLIKLALGTHVAVGAIDRPDIQKWGATLSHADDWHADLFAAAQGMLMPGGITDEQHDQLMKILAWEADKQVEYGISKKWRTWPGRTPDHSCGESNAWSATLLQTARVRLPDHERQEAWRQSAIDYSLNAISVPDDMTSEQVVAGRPLKERVKGANFEPGGIQEHHGFYHPGYMGWPLAYQAYAYLMDQELHADERDPDVYLHNWKMVFDRLKQATFYNGRFIYCAGFDWISYGYGNTQFFPAAIFAADQLGDPDATCMADNWLKLIEYQQNLTGGSIQGSRQATMQRLRSNDYAWYEGQEGCCLAQALWVLDRIDGRKIQPPSSEAEFNRKNVGTYYEPNARLVWYRDPVMWASASWRSAFGQWQMLVQPVDQPHLLKFNHNAMGAIEAVGTSRRLSLESFGIGAFDDGGFWTIGTIGQMTKSVVHSWPDNRVFPMLREHQAMAVVPGGPVVWMDYCQALDQIWLLRNHALGYRLAADIFTGNQVTLGVDGREKVFGQHPHRDTWHDLQSDAVTIEGGMTIRALRGEGTFHLLQKRGRPADASEMLYADDPFGAEESLLAHELYFGPPVYDRAHIVSPEEWFREVVLLFDCSGKKGATEPEAVVTGEFPCVAVHLPQTGRTIAVNFAETERTIDTPTGRIDVKPQSVRVVRQ